MTLTEYLIGFWSLSCGFWMLFYLISNLSASGFLSKRYRLETNLLNTVFFKKHATFIEFLPNFIAGGFFATHLVMCTWGWRFYGKKKMFCDIKDPQYVTQHFSIKEIWRAKIVLLSGVICFTHLLVYFLLRIVWP